MIYYTFYLALFSSFSIAVQTNDKCKNECSWGPWEQYEKCNGSYMILKRSLCCVELNENECFRACEKSRDDTIRKVPCATVEIHGLQGHREKRSSTQKCVPVDLVFVMDASGSVTSSNFEKMLTFASNLLNSFTIGPEDTRVALVVFSTTASRIFNFDRYSTRGQIQSAIGRAPYDAGWTHTAKALSLTRSTFVSNSAKRSTAMSLAIVLTDGKSNDAAETKSEALKLHDKGVMVFCIGIGSKLNTEELEHIASNPNDKFLINANDFDALNSKITQLVHSLCIDDVLPSFLTCEMEIHDNYGEKSQSKVETGKPTSCTNQQDFYGKYQVDSVKTKVEVEGQHTSTKPSAVDDFHYGITSVTVTRVERSVTGVDTVLGGVYSVPIKNSPQRLVSHNITLSNSGSLHNGERFCLIYRASAGGYVTFKGKTYIYRNSVATRHLCYYFDNEAPKHCKDFGSCSTAPLVLSTHITNSVSLSAFFTGWQDLSPVTSQLYASGILHYELNVYEMMEASLGSLSMDTSPKISPEICNSCTQFDISLPAVTNPSLYAVVLEVVDVALNVRHARAFVLFDNSSAIEIHPNHPLLVTSASENSSHKWQTEFGNVCYSWKDRYYNNKYVHHNPLLPIQADAHGHFTGVYDQTSGYFSSTGTKNIHGIIKNIYSLQVGKSYIATNVLIVDVMKESVCTPVPQLRDGDTVTLLLTVSDVVSNMLHDNVTHFIDTSPPEILNMWLIRDGQSKLYVHRDVDLSTMTVAFEAYDIHSGLLSVKWSFGSSDDNNTLGIGAIGIEKLSTTASCTVDSKCYCPSVGICEYFNFSTSLNSLIANNTRFGHHHREYFFEVEATNIAKLTTIRRLVILVDDSPPEPGVVNDGPTDSADLDYTSSSFLTFNWKGFIDHESGIFFYRVVLSNSCIDQTTLLKNENITFRDTSSEFIEIDVATVGFYVLTVAAFNNAYEPSKPVCSDGILYDKVKPQINQIKIQHLKTFPAIGCDAIGSWYISNNVTKYKLDPSHPCSVLCATGMKNGLLDLVPGVVNHSKEVTCNKNITFDNVLFYLKSDKIMVEWNISEKGSKIEDVLIGLGSSINSKDSPDIENYVSSTHRHFFEKRHSGLGSNTPFYIFVKVINKAGLMDIASYGPIIIDESPPQCLHKPQVDVSSKNLHITWSVGDFLDVEQGREIGLIYYRLRNDNSYFSKYMKWEISFSLPCNANKRCINLDVSDIPGSNSTELYYIEFHVYNYVGQFCVILSDPFTIPALFRPAIGGIYDIEVPHNRIEYPFVDVDITFASHKFCIGLTANFYQQDIKFLIGVGTSKELDDVIPLKNVTDYKFLNDKNMIICDTSSLLQAFHQYFVTVQAMTLQYSTVVSTNGFRIINETNFINNVLIFDGVGCKHVSPIVDKVYKLYLNENSSQEFNFDFPLHLGQSYTIDIISGSSTIRTPKEHVKVLSHDDFSVSVISYVHYPVFTIVNKDENNKTIVGLSIKECSEDVKVQSSTRPLSAHWYLKSDLSKYVTHFQISFLKTCSFQKNCTQTIGERNVGQSTFVTMEIDALEHGFYYSELKICFLDKCTTGIQSDGFYIQGKLVDSPEFSASMADSKFSCYNINIEMKIYGCPSPPPFDKASVYRWGVFDDGFGNKALTDTFTEQGDKNSTILKVERCIQLPVYSHRPLYVCLDGMCMSGLTPRSCKSIQMLSNPNTLSKDIVFDLDAIQASTFEFEKYKYSKNIGDKIKDVSRLELDYGHDIKVAGLLLDVGNRTVTWSIMKESRIPISCDSDIDCIASVLTNGGFVTFSSKVNLLDNIIYYLCANVSKAKIITGSSEKVLHARQLCSDGFMMDRIPPTVGTVIVSSSKNGFITKSTDIKLRWDGFKDSSEYRKMGYTDGIASYSYSIGTYPLQGDVLLFQNNGLSKSVVVRNMSLTPGMTYYVSVKAVDHVGNLVSAVSEPFTFDSSPPVRGQITVDNYLYHRHFIQGPIFSVHWKNFYDRESGIHHYKIGIGNTRKADNVHPFYDVISQSTDIKLNDKFQDGHQYLVLLQAVNNAGLMSMMTSFPFVVDRSSPVQGLVHEGHLIDQTDVDFLSSTTSFDVNWSGFYDAHSDIEHYEIGLGTSRSTTDVRPFFNVGLQQMWQWNAVLLPGIKYYTSVKACNFAGLCTIATSNGIILDNTPPVAGVVRVGRQSNHVKYMPEGSFLEISWRDFYDVQSSIKEYEVCIGKTILHCEIAHPRTYRLETSATVFGIQLPINTELYATVTAWNNAGLNVSKSSSAFKVDVSPPMLHTVPYIQTPGAKEYTYDRSLVRIFWEFVDNESPIIKHLISIKTHHGGHNGTDVFEVGNERNVTITLEREHWIGNGDRLFASVTACNAAGLCSTNQSTDVTFDSTPPFIGHLFDPLWSNTNNEIVVNLKNFSDPESGIDGYFLGLGQTYSGSEISNGIIYKSHFGQNIDVQTFIINTTRHVNLNEKLIISFWARNRAGLNSTVRKLTFLVSRTISNTEGHLLQEKHSCEAAYCNFDCTCAVLTGKCTHLVSTTSSCKELNSSSKLNQMIVSVGLNKKETFTTSSSCISAFWDTENTNAIRYEWSMGLMNMPVGYGVFDIVNEVIWSDVNTHGRTTHCLTNNRHLQQARSYVTYIKAWLSFSEYVIYKSDPVLVDTTPPIVNRGKFIVDSSGGCHRDVEFLLSNEYTACWENVFSDLQSGIKQYNVYIGTTFGGDDVTGIINVGKATSYTWSNLNLHPENRYFTTVEAINNAGLLSRHTSDGFIYDSKPPLPGTVYNTEFFSNQHWQKPANSITASWEGFSDHESFIDKYYVKLVKDNTDINTVPFKNAQLRNTYTFTNIIMNHGDTFYIIVKAKDAAGHFSSDVISQPINIDGTAPTGYICEPFQFVFQQNFSILNKITTFKSNTFLLKKNALYNFKVVLSGVENIVYMQYSIQNTSHILPLQELSNRSYQSLFTYLSKVQSIDAITVIVTSLSKSLGFVSLVVTECVNLQFDDKNALSVRQISPTNLMVTLHAIDEESGLIDLELGASMTNTTCWIKSIRSSTLLSNYILPVDMQHKSILYVTASATNHVSLNTLFYAAPVIIDHTPPVISKIEVSYRNKIESSSVVTIFSVSWSVSEDESNLKSCYCAFGSERGTSNIQDWTVSVSPSTCTSQSHVLQHSTKVFTSVRCTNTLEMTTEAHSNPLSVSFAKPYEEQSAIQFAVNSVKLQQNVQTQRHSTSLYFAWNPFQDASGITNYHFCIKTDENAIYNWTNIQKHNYVSIDNLILHNGMEYTALVFASNEGNISSDVINASITIRDVVPVQTGNHCKLLNTTDNSGVELHWSDVFDTEDNLLPVYTVNIGSSYGYSDILRNFKTVNTHFKIDNYANCKTLFTVITAKYAIGTWSTYRDQIDSRC